MPEALTRTHEELHALDAIRRHTADVLAELRLGRELGGVDSLVPLTWAAGKFADYDNHGTPWAGVLVINMSEADAYLGFAPGQGRELAADLELGPRCWVALPLRASVLSIGGESAGRALVVPLHVAPTPAMGQLSRPEPKFAPISASAGGNTAVVAAVPGKRIRVTDYTVIAAGAVTVKFQSNATDISGPMPFGANGGTSPSGLQFQTAVGEALNINLGGAIVVGGHVAYTLEG